MLDGSNKFYDGIWRLTKYIRIDLYFVYKVWIIIFHSAGGWVEVRHGGKRGKENAPFQKKKAVVLCVYKFALQRRDWGGGAIGVGCICVQNWDWNVKKNFILSRIVVVCLWPRQ